MYYCGYYYCVLQWIWTGKIYTFCELGTFELYGAQLHNYGIHCFHSGTNVMELVPLISIYFSGFGMSWLQLLKETLMGQT